MNEFNKSRDERLSINFYLLRSVAILSVAFAHCVYSNTEYQRITSFVGLFGVPIFLVLSGYYFNAEGSISLFIKKKLKVIIPWIVWGILTYSFMAVRSKGFSIYNLFLWIVGYKTWLYYIPVLIITQCIFWKFYKSNIFSIIMVITTIISIVVTYALEPNIGITNYQNPLNWVGFFASGRLVQNNKERIYSIISKSKGLLWMSYLTLSVVFIPIYYFSTIEISYFNIYSFLIETLGSIGLVSICFILAQSSNRRIQDNHIMKIGKNTLIIYFLHMQFGIGIAELFTNLLGENPLVIIIQPVLAVLISYMISKLIILILGLIKLKNYLWILGIKDI